MSAEDANIRRPSPPRFSFSLSFPSWRQPLILHFNLTVFVLFVQEYGRKHGSELADRLSGGGRFKMALRLQPANRWPKAASQE